MGGRRSRWSCSRSSRRRTATCGRSLDSSYAWVRGPYSDADDLTETTEIAGQRAGLPPPLPRHEASNLRHAPEAPSAGGRWLRENNAAVVMRGSSGRRLGARFASRFSDG